MDFSKPEVSLTLSSHAFIKIRSMSTSLRNQSVDQDVMLRGIMLIYNLADCAHNLPTMAGAILADTAPESWEIESLRMYAEECAASIRRASEFESDVLDKLPPPERVGS